MLTIALAVVAAIVAVEVIEWCRPAQRWVIGLAVARLPVEHRARYREEWEAELATVPGGPVSRFLFVVSLLGRTRELSSALRERARDLADVLAEAEERRMKVVIAKLPLFSSSWAQLWLVVAEAPNGEQYAWLWMGRMLRRMKVPPNDWGFDRMQPADMRYMVLPGRHLRGRGSITVAAPEVRPDPQVRSTLEPDVPA